MAQLTDKQKKKIIADYIETNNYSETSRINKVAVDTVKRLVKGNESIARKSKQKKEQNTEDMLKYLDSLAGKQKSILSLSLDKIEAQILADKANIRDLISIYGVMMDKIYKAKELELKGLEIEKQTNAVEDLTTLADLFGFNK